MNIFKSFNEQVAFSRQRSHRIEELSDGFFAIVMTLLVLDIRIPIMEMKTEGDILKSLKSILPNVLTFILSFTVVGQLWTVFINQFNHIQESDRSQTVIALFCLLPISLIPFTASLLSEYSWSRVAIGLYVLNILVILLLFLGHWVYCFHAGLLKRDDNQEQAIHRIIVKRARIIITAYAIVACLSFISRSLAIGGTIFLQVVVTFSTFIEKSPLLWKFILRFAVRPRNKRHRYSQRP
jgi:uncharacterized membrane protein